MHQMACCKTPEDEKESTFLGKWKELSQRTSAHGAAIICDASSSKLRRITYGIFFIWMLAATIACLVTLIEKVVQGDTDTKITVDSTINKLAFPAITICNFNTYTKSFLGRDWGDNDTADAIHYLLEAAYEDLYAINPRFINNTKIDKTYENVTEIFTEAAHSLSSTFSGCAFNRVFIDCSKMFRTVITDHGVCFQFPGGNDTGYLVRESGSKYGMTLYLTARPEMYTAGVSQMSIGFQILVHHPDEPAQMTTSSFAVMPGAETFVSVSKEEFHLPIQSKCVVTSGSTSANNPLSSLNQQGDESYTSASCKLGLLSTCAVDKCGCKLFNYPGNYTVCSRPSAIICARKAIEDCLVNVTVQQESQALCPLRCDSHTYRSSLSYATFPSPVYIQYARQYFNWSEEYTKINMGKVKIYYDTLEVRHTSQVPYSLEQLVGSFGGQLGFCLGASFITLVEFTEFLCGLPFWCISKMYKAFSRVGAMSSTKVSTIS